MTLHLYQITLVLALVLATAEIFTLGFFFLAVAIGVLAVAPIHLLTDTFDFARDVSIAAGVSTASFIAFRKIFRQRGDEVRGTGDINRY